MFKAVWAKKTAVQIGALCLVLATANCSGKTYSTLFQPFDLIFGGTGPANAADPVTLLAATPLTPTRVMLTFDEPVTLSTAQLTANYTIVGPNGIAVVVLSAVRDPNNSSVVYLDTTPQTGGSEYTVTVSNVTGVDGSVLSAGQRSATFTALNNADQVPPTIASATVVNATTIDVYFTEALTPSTTTAGANYRFYSSAAACTGDGAFAAGTAATSGSPDANNASHVTLTVPALTIGNTYYLGARNVRDYWGNTITTATCSAAFVYSAPAPKILSAVLSGTTPNAALLVTYDQAMTNSTQYRDKNRYTIGTCSGGATVNTAPATGTAVGTDKVLLTGVTTTGTGSGSCTLVVTPTTSITSTLGATLGAAPNNTAYFTYNTTVADTTPPAVLSVTPASPNSSNTLEVVFNEPVTGVTAADFSFSPALNVTGVSCSANICTLTTSDQTTTSYGMTITNASGGIQDSTGNTLNSGTTTFTGDGKPYIVAIIPLDPENIIVQWSETISTIQNGDYTAPNGISPSVNVNSVSFYPTAGAPSHLVKINISTLTPLTSGSTYTFSLPTSPATTDSNGNSALTTTSGGISFTGPSTTVPPTISATGVTALSTTTLRVVFNEPVDNSSLALTNFVLDNTAGCPTPLTGNPTAAVQVSAGVILLTVGAGAGANPCGIDISGVKDLLGNSMAANSFNYNYPGTTGGDTTAPGILSVVSLSSTQIQVFFSEPMNTSGTAIIAMNNMANYSLSGGLTISSLGTCTGSSCIINTSAQTAATYTLTVGTGIRDAAGNATTSDLTASFTGTPGSSARPTLYFASLLNSTTVELNFSEAMNLSTAECVTAGPCAAKYTVSGGNSVSQAIRQSDPTKVRLTITPGAYGASNTYTVTGDMTVLTDVAGNLLTTPNSVTFSGSATAPSITDLAAGSDSGSSNTDNNTGFGIFPTPGLVFNGTVTPGTIVTLYDNGNPVATTVADGTGAYNFTVGTNPGDGTHNYTIATVGPTGLVSDASTPLVVIIDTTIPNQPGSLTLVAASDSGFSNSDHKTNATTPSFTVTCDSGATVILRNGTTDITNPAGGVNCASSPVTLTASTLAAGTYTINVVQVDTAGNTSTASANLAPSLVIDTAGPSISATTLTSNSYIQLNFVDPTLADAVYDNATSAGASLNAADFGIVYNDGGSGVLVTIGCVTNTAATNCAGMPGTAPAVGATAVRVILNVTGTPTGSESITLNSATNSIFDAAGNPATFTTGVKTFTAGGIANISGIPTYTSTGTSTGYISVTWDEAAHSQTTGVGQPAPLVPGDFTVTYAQNGGNAAQAVITSITNNAGGALTGGETSIRIYIENRTGGGAATATSGAETIQIFAAANEIFSTTNLATPATENTGIIALPDTLSPVVTGISSSSADGTYKTGNTVSIQVTFSEVVNVVGTPQLTLATGTPATTAVNYVSGSGSNTLNFTYTIAAGNNSLDLDYAAVGSLSAGTSIRDAANNNATLTLPVPGAASSLGANKAIIIDAVAPTVTSVNSSTADGAYRAGQTITVLVNFSEAVTVTGTPQLTLETGATDAVVNYSSGSGTSQLTFTYTIGAGQNSADLDYASTTALALNGGTITDAIGNNATLTLVTPGAANSLGANKAIVVDTTAATVTSVNSSTGNGTYRVGQSISIQVNFSEAVTVTGTPQLTLETGGTDAVVNYASGSGTNQLTFTYTIASPEISGDLDYQSTGALGLNGGAINDAAGNAATLTLASPGAANSLGANKALVVDGVSPTVTSVTATTADGSYGVGQAISVRVNFSENVTVTGTPQLTLETGTTDAVVNYASGSGTNQLTFTYTIAAGEASSDLDYQSTTALVLNGGTINDSAGNTAILTLVAPGAVNSMGNAKAIVVDGVAPTVTNVNSSTADGTYGIGQTVSIQVNFSEAVTVTGTPQITLETGTTDAVVNYVSGSGSSTLNFTYTIASSHTTADLDYLSTSALALNGGTIRDSVNNNATLTLASPGAANSLGNAKAIVIDGVAPTVTSVNSSTADGPHGVGRNISIQINFSETVTVSGTPQLTLETGTTDAVVNYSSGSGTNQLTFTYTVASGHTSSDLDYLNTTALALNGGSIRDAASNNATLTLASPGAANSLGANKALVIETVAPVISAVTPASSATVNNTLVSFTYSEVCATATITWTRTGGATDAGSPHTQSLTGAELNAGIHSNITITNNPTLVDTGVYTVAWDCTDLAGNVATTVSSTGVIFNSVPIAITSAETMDTDNDGKIDTYRVAFNKNVDDTTFPGYAANSLGSVTTNWLIAGYTNVRLIHGSAVTFATDTANDAIIYIRFDENALVCSAASQVGCDTAAKPDLTTTSTPILKDLGGTIIAQVNTAAVTEADGAKPVLVAARSLSATTADAIFSEAMDVTTAQTISNYAITGGSSPAVSAAVRDGTNTNIVHLTTGTQTGGVTYTLTVNTNVKDLANFNLNSLANTATFDGVVKPVVSSITTTSATTLTITFNESVTAASTECANLSACSAIYTNVSLPVISAVSTGGTGVNSATYTLTVNSMVEGQSYTTTVTQNTVTSVATGEKMGSTNNSATFTGDGRPAVSTVATDTATQCPITNGTTGVARRVVIQYDQSVKTGGGTNAADRAANYSIPTLANGGCITGGVCTGGTGLNQAAASSVTSLGGNKFAVDWTTAFGTDTSVYSMSIVNVQDLNSNTVATPTSVQFQCGSDTTPPSLIGITVVSATAGSTVLLLTFSEAVATVQANTATNYRYDTAAYGAGVNTAAVQSNPAQVQVTFVPALANGGHQLRTINQRDLATSPNTIQDNGVNNVQPFIVNAPTGFAGGPVFTDPFADGTPAGQMVIYDNKIILGWDTASSKFFEMDKGLTTAQTITLDADGNPTMPYTQFASYASTGGSGTLQGLDAIAAGCIGGTSTPSMTGTACSGASGTEFIFAGGFNTTGFYQSVFYSTSKSSSAPRFTFTERGGITNSDNTFRSMSIAVFRDHLFVASPHRGTLAPRIGRICIHPSGCDTDNNGSRETAQWAAPHDMSGELMNMIGKSGLVDNGNEDGGANGGNTVAIDTMYEYDNDGAAANVSQLYVANGGKLLTSILGSTRTAASAADGGILRSRLARSTAGNPPTCNGMTNTNCDANIWENITPTSADWLNYNSIAMPFQPGSGGDWANMLPANRIIPAIKAIPYMRRAPNGDLYMIRNACAVQTMQTVCMSARSSGACNGMNAQTFVNDNFTADFATTANGRRQVCPPGNEVPQLWVLPAKGATGSDGGGDGGNNNSNDWILLASRTFTPQTYPNGSALPSRKSTTLSGNTTTCGVAPNNKCERNAHLTLLEFVGNYLYIGFDNQDHGANIWRVNMNSATCTGSTSCALSGSYPAESQFAIVNDVLGLDGSATNQRIFSHLTVNDSGTDWLILATRDGTNSMKIYRTSNN